MSNLCVSPAVTTSRGGFNTGDAGPSTTYACSRWRPATSTPSTETPVAVLPALSSTDTTLYANHLSMLHLSVINIINDWPSRQMILGAFLRPASLRGHFLRPLCSSPPLPPPSLRNASSPPDLPSFVPVPHQRRHGRNADVNGTRAGGRRRRVNRAALEAGLRYQPCTFPSPTRRVAVRLRPNCMQGTTACRHALSCSHHQLVKVAGWVNITP